MPRTDHLPPRERATRHLRRLAPLDVAPRRSQCVPGRPRRGSLLSLFAALSSSIAAKAARNSLGRITLNVLLSFAQFEREVTSERIRDKIAASKRTRPPASRASTPVRRSPHPV